LNWIKKHIYELNWIYDTDIWHYWHVTLPLSRDTNTTICHTMDLTLGQQRILQIKIKRKLKNYKLTCDGDLNVVDRKDQIKLIFLKLYLIELNTKMETYLIFLHQNWHQMIN